MARSERFVMPEIEKQPYEEFFIFWDFSAELESGETLLDGSIIVAEDKNGLDSTVILVDIGSIVTDDSVVKVRCRAGDPALSPYKVSFRCSTSLGNKYEGDVTVKVVER